MATSHIGQHNLFATVQRTNRPTSPIRPNNLFGVATNIVENTSHIGRRNGTAIF